VTYWLIGITVGIFVLQWIPALGLTEAGLYAPFYSLGEYTSPGIPYEPWRMLTSVFLHSTSSVLHILFNMFTLFVFGRVLEQLLGHGRFLVLYIASGLAGSLGVMLIAPVDTAVIGASGALFGLMGAFVVIQRKLGAEMRPMLLLLGINLVIGFVLPGVAWQAHLGGLVGGVAIGFIFVQTRSPARRQAQGWWLAGFCALLVVAALSHAPMFV
jgi:membrane associated rhomboid family serine protease